MAWPGRGVTRELVPSALGHRHSPAQSSAELSSNLLELPKLPNESKVMAEQEKMTCSDELNGHLINRK